MLEWRGETCAFISVNLCVTAYIHRCVHIAVKQSWPCSFVYISIDAYGHERRIRLLFLSSELANILQLCLHACTRERAAAAVVQGAEVVYNQLIRPHLLQHEKRIDGAVDQVSAVGVAAAEGLQQALNEGASLVNQAAGIVRHRKGPQLE